MRETLVDRLAQMWESNDSQIRNLGVELAYSSFLTYEEYMAIHKKRGMNPSNNKDTYYTLWETVWTNKPHPNDPKYNGNRTT